MVVDGQTLGMIGSAAVIVATVIWKAAKLEAKVDSLADDVRDIQRKLDRREPVSADSGARVYRAALASVRDEHG